MPDQPAPGFEEARRAMERLAKSRRVLAHSRACPLLDGGSCACGAEEAANDLGTISRTVKFLLSEREAREEAIEAAREYREEFAKRGVQTAESAASWDKLNTSLAALPATESAHKEVQDG